MRQVWWPEGCYEGDIDGGELEGQGFTKLNIVHLIGDLHFECSPCCLALAGTLTWKDGTSYCGGWVWCWVKTTLGLGSSSDVTKVKSQKSGKGVMKWPDGRWHKGTYFKEGTTESGAFVCLLPVFGRSWSIWWSRTNGMAEAALLGADPNAVFSSRHVLIKKATGPPLHSSFFADLCGKRMSSRLYQSISPVSPVFQKRFRTVTQISMDWSAVWRPLSTLFSGHCHCEAWWPAILWRARTAQNCDTTVSSLLAEFLSLEGANSASPRDVPVPS